MYGFTVEKEKYLIFKTEKEALEAHKKQEKSCGMILNISDKVLLENTLKELLK